MRAAATPWIAVPGPNPDAVRSRRRQQAEVMATLRCTPRSLSVHGAAAMEGRAARTELIRTPTGKLSLGSGLLHRRHLTATGRWVGGWARLRVRRGVGWVGAMLARTVLEFCVCFMKSYGYRYMYSCTSTVLEFCVFFMKSQNRVQYTCTVPVRVQYIQTTIHRHF